MSQRNGVQARGGVGVTRFAAEGGALCQVSAYEHRSPLRGGGSLNATSADNHSHRNIPLSQ